MMICSCLIGIVVFNELQETVLLIGALLLFLISFQLSMGPIFFIHVTETCVETVVGFASQILFIFVMLASLITPFLIDYTGTRGVFIFYSSCSIIGLIYMCIYVKDSSYTVDTDVEPGCTGPKKRFSSNREKKELYMPAEFKEGYLEK